MVLKKTEDFNTLLGMNFTGGGFGYNNRNKNNKRNSRSGMRMRGGEIAMMNGLSDLFCKCSTTPPTTAVAPQASMQPPAYMQPPASTLPQPVSQTPPVVMSANASQASQASQVSQASQASQASPASPATQSQTGGKYFNDKKKLYKKKLEGLTKDKLLAMAKKSNIKVTQKKNNVTSVVKKDTLVKKLVAYKFT
jgi:hypothetical protein